MHRIIEAHRNPLDQSKQTIRVADQIKVANEAWGKKLPSFLSTSKAFSVCEGRKMDPGSVNETSSDANVEGAAFTTPRPLLPSFRPRTAPFPDQDPPSGTKLAKRPAPIASACAACRKRKSKVTLSPAGLSPADQGWIVQRNETPVCFVPEAQLELPIRHGRRRRNLRPSSQT